VSAQLGTPPTAPLCAGANGRGGQGWQGGRPPPSTPAPPRTHLAAHLLLCQRGSQRGVAGGDGRGHTLPAVHDLQACSVGGRSVHAGAQVGLHDMGCMAARPWLMSSWGDHRPATKTPDGGSHWVKKNGARLNTAGRSCGNQRTRARLWHLSCKHPRNTPAPTLQAFTAGRGTHPVTERGQQVGLHGHHEGGFCSPAVKQRACKVVGHGPLVRPPPLRARHTR